MNPDFPVWTCAARSSVASSAAGPTAGGSLGFCRQIFCRVSGGWPHRRWIFGLLSPDLLPRQRRLAPPQVDLWAFVARPSAAQAAAGPTAGGSLGLCRHTFCRVSGGRPHRRWLIDRQHEGGVVGYGGDAVAGLASDGHGIGSSRCRGVGNRAMMFVIIAGVAGGCAH